MSLTQTTHKGSRMEVLGQLRNKIRLSQPIVGRYLDPHSKEQTDACDLFALSHIALFPEHGVMAGLMPFGDANKIVMELSDAALAIAKETPVIASISATDPFRLIHIYLKEIREAGFAGIQNFPSMGILDGDFREHLESSGGGYGKEIELIRLGHESGLLTIALVFDPDSAAKMAEAGADVLVVISGEEDDSNLRDEMSRVTEAAKTIRNDIILLCGNYCPDGSAQPELIWRSNSGVDGYWVSDHVRR